MNKKIVPWLILFTIVIGNAHTAMATDYTFGGPDPGLFGSPTSTNAAENLTKNIDRSKNSAYIPPVFGSPTMDLLNSGVPLTPNLLENKDTINAGVTLINPSTPNISDSPLYKHVYTEVTNDLYYSAGHLATLKIPAIGLTVKVYQGTDNAALKKGAGHFATTSIWDGNVAIAGHNRGVSNHFGQLHQLDHGDKITYTTRLGTRTYKVYSVRKISETDNSILTESPDNILTLVTCVRNQRDYRWCIQAKEY